MQTLRFEGNGSEYFKIWIVNILLTIVTLGVYYPWAKVRNHRYFYGNTFFENRNFEYHATGKQLFKSYAIAMSIAGVLALLQYLSSVLIVVFAIVIFAAGPWIIWRSLMFNMYVTSFSNVRFSFVGTLKGSYSVFMILPFLALLVVIILTFVVALLYAGGAFTTGKAQVLSSVIFMLIFLLGLIFYQAYIKKRVTEYQLNGSKFGQGEFKASLQTSKLFMIGLKALGLGVVIYLGLWVVFAILFALVFGVSALTGVASDYSNLEATSAAFGLSFVFMVILLYLAVILAGFFLFSFVAARTRAYLYSNTTLDDDIRFSSTLGATQLAIVMSTNLLMIVLSLGLATPWAKVRLAKLMAEQTGIEAEDIDHFVTQQEDYQSAMGEELGDALDIDVGVVGI